MVQVSRVNVTGKLPSFNINGSSSKHIYDGVFSSQPQNKLKSSEFTSFNDDDYGEIFGSSKVDNGVWQSSCSSIPILELPVSEQRRCGIDFSEVFGGCEDEGFDIPDGEELLDQLKKKPKICSVSMPRRNGYTNQATGSLVSHPSQNGQAPTKGFKSFDSMKHVQQQNNEMPVNQTEGKTQVVHGRAIPESTFSLHEVGPSQKNQTSRIPVIKGDTELAVHHLAEKVELSIHNSSDLGVMEHKSKHTTDFLKASSFNGSIPAAISHATLQPTDEDNSATHVDDVHAISGSTYLLHEVSPQKTQISGTHVIKADTEFDMDNNLEKTGKRYRNTSHCIAEEEKNEQYADFHKAPGLSESSSDAASHAILQPTDETNGASATYVAGAHAIPGYLLPEVGPSQKTETSETHVIEADAELGMDIDLEKKGKHSRYTSSDLVADEEKHEHDAGIQKASGLSESNSSVTSHATRQSYTVAGPSKMGMSNAEMKFNAKDDIRADGSSFSGVNQQNNDDVDAPQKESNSHMSNLVTTSHNTCQASSIERSSNVVKDEPEVATAFDLGKKQRRHSRMTSLDLGDYRQAHGRDARFQRNSRSRGSYSFDASHDRFSAHIRVQLSKSSEDSLYRGDGGSPPSLDEQLDINSAAAVSAAALQRVLEQAEMRIRLAKEFLERESPGSTKLRFKDTLKTKIINEEKQEYEINEFRQKTMHVNCGRVDHVKQACSHSEKKSVLETAHVEPVLEDQKIFLKDDEPIIKENAKASKFIEEGDKRGGEWEAAKHLNQLITGVKNRLASFMTWQSEKKEEPKEVEAHGPQQSEKKEEPKEVKETEKYQSATVCAGEAMLEEDKIVLIPEAKELEENDSTRCKIADQETAGGRVGLTPETEGPTRANFLFFSFNSERSWNHHHSEEVEKKTAQESWKLGIENRQEQLMYESKNEWTQGSGKAANHAELDDMMTQDCGGGLGEIDEMEEELHSMSAHDSSESSHEEDDNKRLNEDHRYDRGELTHEESDNSSVTEECGNDSGVNEECQNNNNVNEECGDNSIVTEECRGDIINLICEEDNERRVNGEYGNNSSVNEECGNDIIELTRDGDNERTMIGEFGDYKSRSTQEVDVDRMVNEEYGDDSSKLTHEEDDERTMNAECGVDGSKFTDEEEIRRLNVNHEEGPINNYHCPENIIKIIEKDDEWNEDELIKKTEEQPDNAHLEEMSLVGETGKRAETTREGCGWQEYEGIQGSIDPVDDESVIMNGFEDDKRYERQCNHTDMTEKEVTVQASCIAADDGCGQTENVVLSEAEEASNGIEGCDPGVEEAVFPDGDSHIVLEISDYSSESEMDLETSALPDEEGEKKTEIANPSLEPKMDMEKPVFTQLESDWIEEEREVTSFSTENSEDCGGVEYVVDTDGALPCKNFVLHDCETDLNCRPKDIDLKAMESKSEDNLENQTNHLNESTKTLDVEEVASVGDQEGEKESVDAVHRRRRWFENGERPSILEGNITNLEIEQEALEESDLAGGVQIHTDKLDCETKEESTARAADITTKQEDVQVNVESNHKRRRWFVRRGEEGVPEPPSLFAGLKVASEMNHEAVNEIQHHNMSDGSIDNLSTESGDTLHVAEDADVSGETRKQNIEAAPRRKRWFESGVNVEPTQQLRTNVDAGTTVEIDQEHKLSGDLENGKLGNVPILEGKDDLHNKVEEVNEHHGDLDAVKKRKKEKKKERIAVAKAIREARERAFSEARERARRDAADRANTEACQTAGSGVEDRPGEVSADENSSDKASMEAKIRAERAAVERATIEARERALRKALSEKASRISRKKGGKHPFEKSSSLDPKYHNSSSYSRCSDSLNNDEKFDGADGESMQRRKTRLERQNQTMDRAAKVLEEKNKHDAVAQKEQAARNMFADALDAEFRRWSCGKDGNLRALLSTLHYILGSDSGWQAVSISDLVAPTAVRKAYKKATLCVHPDKLQQRGATIEQKYICEKVFDILKDAWNKFNPDEC